MESEYLSQHHIPYPIGGLTPAMDDTQTERQETPAQNTITRPPLTDDEVDTLFRELDLTRLVELSGRLTTSSWRSRAELENWAEDGNPARDETIASLTREIRDLRRDILDIILGSVERATEFLAASRAARLRPEETHQQRQDTPGHFEPAHELVQHLPELPYPCCDLQEQKMTMGPDDAGMLARLGRSRTPSEPARSPDAHHAGNLGGGAHFSGSFMEDRTTGVSSWLHLHENVKPSGNVGHGAGYPRENGWFEAQMDLQPISRGFSVARRSPVEGFQHQSLFNYGHSTDPMFYYP